MTTTLYNDDCLKILKTLGDETIDLVVTDPPYNENYQYRDSAFVDKREDYYEFLVEVFKELKRVLKLSGSLYFKHSSKQIGKILPLLSCFFTFRNLIIWISNSMAHPYRNYDSYYEPIYFYTKTIKYTFNKKAEFREKPKNYWSGSGKEFVGILCNCWYDIKKVQAGCLKKTEGGTVGNKKLHPCSMPVRLAERAIKVSSNPGDLVLDPFMGSGTTGIACKRLGRNFIGIELDKKYFELAQNRVNEEGEQLL